MSRFDPRERSIALSPDQQFSGQQFSGQQFSGQRSSSPQSSGQQSICQSCGACCAYDASWPRFSLEAEEDLALIPEHLIADDKSGMRCENNRCLSLAGEIGRAVGCSIYSLRPDVCRACQPGDAACNLARAKYGFTPIEST